MKVKLRILADHNDKVTRITSNLAVPSRCLKKVKEELQSINEKVDYMTASYNPSDCTVFVIYDRQADESVQDITQAVIWVFRTCAEVISAFPEIDETVEVEL